MQQLGLSGLPDKKRLESPPWECWMPALAHRRTMAAAAAAAAAAAGKRRAFPIPTGQLGTSYPYLATRGRLGMDFFFAGGWSARGVG